jgi:hypothetical protein
MSELIDSGARTRRGLLEHLILQIHEGVAPGQVQRQLVRLLGRVPCGLVVEVEQELLAEGLPAQEVTQDLTAKRALAGEQRLLSRSDGGADA